MNSQSQQGTPAGTVTPLDTSLLIREAARAVGLPMEGSRDLAEKISAAGERLFDIVAAITALALTWPIMLVVAIIIRRDSPGPALLRQIRVGKNGKLFKFYKFRTLYADAKARFPEMYAYQYTPDELRELQIHREDDPRVTPAGNWLRKSSLDELPNFLNLLKGDIALVGPRPQIPELMRYHYGEELIKFSVKPGITGLAQIRGRGRLKFLEGLRYDVEYVKNKSFWYDLKILVNTIKCVLKLDGAF